MSGAVDSLDHIGIAVPDLAAAAATFRRLGFQLTPLQQQAGPLEPGGPVLRWGSANHCAMLEQGYLEIIGIVDAALYDNQLGAFLARYHGIHILALGVADAEGQVERLRKSGLPVAGVRPMQRPVTTQAGMSEVRFKRVPLADAPEGRIQLIEHLTPALMWQDHLLDHPNRVVALTETVLCVADVAEAAERFRRLAGSGPLRHGRARIFAFAAGRLVLCDPASLGDFISDGSLMKGGPPTLPWFAGFSVATDDGNAAIRQILLRNRIDFAEHGGGDLVLPAAASCGAICRFRPHPPSPRPSSPHRARDASIAASTKRGR
ncbi:MAG TPA: VOC family protein [Stellaceae bacterium]|nr:VOC family protein [Stellaceae bacterium]